MKLSTKEIAEYQLLAIQIMEKSINEKRPDNSISPKVGAVIVYEDPITKEKKVEMAYRGEIRNGDHAEFTLIDRKLRNVELTGAVMFVTLEPCAPNSRKHPKISCAERIVNARVEKVYVGIQDPYPSVNSRGMNFLKDNGVVVEMFDKERQDRIKKINIDFLDQAANKVFDESDYYFFSESKLDKISSESSFSDLSTEALEEYSKLRELKLDVQSEEFKIHLSKIGLLRKDDGGYLLTYACLLLFGKEPEQFIPGSSVICKNTQVIPHLVSTIRGPLVLIPGKIEDWFRLNSLKKYSRETASAREDYIIPFEIFREGMINALVHRNYEITSGNVHIDVSENEVRISSPGLPSSPITLAKLQSFTAPSFSRYPRLTYVFSTMRLMERANMGLGSFIRSRKIVNSQYSYNEPMLELRMISLERSVSSNDTINNPRTNFHPIRNDNLPNEILVSLEESVAKENEEIRSIIRLIANEGPVSKQFIAEKLDINVKTVQRILAEYIDKQVLTSTGTTSNKKFSINKKI